MEDRISHTATRKLRSLPVQVAVRVCNRSLKLDELLQWTPGTILSFDRLTSDPLTICVGSNTLGEGQAVTIGPKIGLRLSRISKPSN